MAGITVTLYPNAGGSPIVVNWVKFMDRSKVPLDFDHKAQEQISHFGNVAINGPSYPSKRLWAINAEAISDTVLTNIQALYRTWETERATGLWVPDLRLQDETLPFDKTNVYQVTILTPPKYTYLSKKGNWQVQFSLKELVQL